MEGIRCIIVDDEPLAIDLLTKHVAQVPELTLVATASNPIDALSILKSEQVDLMFIDIQMPVLTGIELVKTLPDPPAVVFTTAYREYAVESYDLNVLDYLMKPITFIRFIKSVNKYFDLNDKESVDIKIVKEPLNEQAKSIYVNVNKRYVKVVFDTIRYIESVKDYIHIHTLSESVVTKEKISDFMSKLPDGFIRVHRSFIVNRQMITAFTAQDVEIGEKKIPIGTSYKEEVLSILK